MIRSPIGVMVILSLFCSGNGLLAQEEDRIQDPAVEPRGQVPFRAWVSLQGSAPLARLENENRISEICTDSEVQSDCYSQQLAPSVVSVPLHAGPDGRVPQAGELLVVVVPGRGLSAFYRPAQASIAPVFFTPDLFLQDWGYGLLFHQTIADQRGDWFKLPPGPWASPVWLHVPHGTGSSFVIEVQAGEIIDIEGTGWYVVSSGRDHLMLRPEQPGDFWCYEGDPPPIEETQSTRFLRAELLDADGHLAIRPKYLKGC